MEKKRKERNKTKTNKKELLKLVSLGYSDKEISEKLNLSYSGVRYHITTLMIETGTVNRAHLIGYAYRNQMI